MNKLAIVFLIGCISMGYALQCYQCVGGKKCATLDKDTKVVKCDEAKYGDNGFPTDLGLPIPEGTKPEGTQPEGAKPVSADPEPEYNCLHFALGDPLAVRTCYRGKTDGFEKSIKAVNKLYDVDIDVKSCNEDKCNSDKNSAASVTFGLFVAVLPILTVLVR